MLAYFVVFIPGGSGIGTWFGKAVGLAFQLDRAYWGDVGGVYGGLTGLGVAIGVSCARLTT